MPQPPSATELQAAWKDLLATTTIPADVLDWAANRDNPALSGAAYSLLGLRSALTFDHSDALLQTSESIDLYNNVDFDAMDSELRRIHQQLRWSAYNARAKALGYTGADEESVTAHRQTLELAESIGYARGILVSQYNLSIYLLQCGDTTEATFVAHHGRTITTPDLDEQYRPLKHEALAYIYYGSGVPDKALEQLRLTSRSRKGESDFNNRLLDIELAYLEAGYGDAKRSRRILQALDTNRLADVPARLRFAAAAAEARLLGREGRFEQAHELLSTVDLSGPAKQFKDIANPMVCTAEVLLLEERFEEAEAYLRRWCDELAYPAKTKVLILRAEALAQLNRWSEALYAGRAAELARSQLDLDSVRYSKFCERRSGSGVDGQPTPVIADVYARQVRLRDLLGHDIRGLFNSVLLAFESVRFAGDQQQYRDRLSELVSLIDALHDVPANAAAYRQLVDGSSKADLEPISIAVLADEVRLRYALQAERKGVRLEIQTSSDLHVKADREMLRACLCNLVSNAIKFANRGQRIWIEWAPSDDKVDIAVTDQGPGLTAEERKQIFRQERTFAAEPTAGERSSGLGLQIVIGFTEQMAGKVRVENNSDGGSRFVIQLTKAEGRQLDGGDNAQTQPHRSEANETEADGHVSPRPQPSAHTNGAGNGHRVLIVDDDQAVVDVLAELFRHSGADPVTATDYDSASDAIKNEGPFALAIFDVMIDGAPLGLDLVRAAKALTPEAAIVVSSGLGSSLIDEVLDDCVLLPKPIHFEQVAGLVEWKQSDHTPKPSSSDPRPTAPGRSHMLTQVIHRKHLTKAELDLLTTATDPVELAEGLVIAAVHESIHGSPRESLRVSREAEQAISDGVEVDPAFVWQNMNNLGIVFQQLGDLDGSRHQHERTLEYAKFADFEYGIPRSAINLAEIYDIQNQPVEATKTLAWASRQIGADQEARAQVLAHLGRSLFRQGDSILAITELRRALTNFSPLQVDGIRSALRWLFEAYVETADPESATVVLARLQRLDPHPPSPDDVAFNLSAEAVLALHAGDPDRALELSLQALDMTSDERVDNVEHIPIAGKTLLLAYTALERYQDIASTWEQLRCVTSAGQCARTLTIVAEAMEQLGRAKDAYELERRAFSIRCRRNHALPTTVTLAAELAATTRAELATAELLVTEDYATLWSRTEELSDLIRELRAKTALLLAQAEEGDRSVETEVADLMERTELCVGRFGLDTSDLAVVNA